MDITVWWTLVDITVIEDIVTISSIYGVTCTDSKSFFPCIMIYQFISYVHSFYET